MVRRAIPLGAAGAAVAAATLGVAFRVVPPLIEKRKNVVLRRPPYGASKRARDLHASALVVDLHADSLLWGRDLRRRSTIGHIDVPRLIEGGIGIQGFAVSTKVPSHANMERNDDRSDDVRLLALAQRWPRATWGSLLERALYQAARLRTMADGSDGLFTLLTCRGELETYLDRRSRDPKITAGFLAIEGAHALDDDLDNLDRLADAGYRMMSPTHFFDNAFGGSAHGVEKGRLTATGRALIGRLEARSMLVDIAHASPATIDDVLALATRPVIASHTGVRAAFDSVRNLSDEHVRAIGATGGLIGIGFWPIATGGEDPVAIARSIGAAVELAGIEHVGLGSDFDGGVAVPFDATGIVQVTDALLGEGFDDDAIRAILGGNARRVLAGSLPDC
jgi:membrane dipeptidase